MVVAEECDLFCVDEDCCFQAPMFASDLAVNIGDFEVAFFGYFVEIGIDSFPDIDHLLFFIPLEITGTVE